MIPALKRQEPTIDIIRVGDPSAPPRRTQDPDLLIAAEALGKVLVTEDRNTMPGHLVDHYAAGRHTAGVTLLRGGFTRGQYARAILREWARTTADDWIDRTVYLP